MRTSASGKTKMKEIYAPNKKVKAGVYVIAALLVLLYLLPIYVMLNQSFRYVTDLSPRLYLPEEWTLDNYIEAFTSSALMGSFKNSIVLVVEVCAVEIILGGIAAYGLARAGGKDFYNFKNIQHLHYDDTQPLSSGWYLLSDGEISHGE